MNSSDRRSPVAAGLLATVFLLLGLGVLLPVSSDLVALALEGLSPATAAACLLIALRLALPLPPALRNGLVGVAAAAAAWTLRPSDTSGAAPLVSAGLCLAAATLWSERRPTTLSMHAALLRGIPVFGLTLVGLLGAASFASGQRTTGMWLPALAVSPAPAAAFLGLTAWTLRRRAADWLPALRNDDRIAMLTFFVMALLVAVTGITTFWAVQSRLQASEQERLVQSAYRREMAFNYQLDHASRLASEMARRPSIARALLNSSTQPGMAALALQEEVDAVWNDRFTAIRFERAGPGAPLPSRGTFLPSSMPPLSLEQVDDVQLAVQWNGGLLALSRVPVRLGSNTVGWVVSQQRLQLLTEQLFETADLGQGVEVQLCYPASTTEAACLPSAPDAPGTQVPLRQADGSPSAIALAVRGEQGSMLAHDTEGTRVIDVFAAVQRPLGLRLRQSIDAVMAPVRDKLRQVVIVCLVLLAAGVVIMSLQVRPLASRLVRSEQEARNAEARAAANEEHLRTVMDNVADGIVTTDAEGVVTYLNQAAVALTGWPAALAMGLQSTRVYTIVQADGGGPADDPITAALRGHTASASADVDLVRRDGSRLAVADRVSVVRDAAGTTVGSVLVFHDVTAERARTAAISHEASHDALTGLHNRKAFERQLAALATAPTAPGVTAAPLHTVIYIDLDKFKHVNDTAGHEAGDHLLQQVVAVMQQGLRATDLFARVGGDEFAVVLPSCGPADAARIAEGLRAAVAAFTFVWHGRPFHVGTSIGVATFEAGCGDPAAIVREADAACYRAKHAGRGNVQVHDTVVRRATMV